jgi:hypothetical protein
MGGVAAAMCKTDDGKNLLFAAVRSLDMLLRRLAYGRTGCFGAA